MRQHFLISIVLLVFLFVQACQFLPVTTGMNSGAKTQAEDYEEDLTSSLPVYEVEELVLKNDLPEFGEETDPADTSFYLPVNDTVNMALDSIAKIRLAENKVTGYTILVYSSMSREESRKALGRLLQAIPEIEADLIYQQPYFRVKTGKFMHEIHAYGLLQQVKEEFNTAIIVPETYKISEPEDDN